MARVVYTNSKRMTLLQTQEYPRLDHLPNSSQTCFHQNF